MSENSSQDNLNREVNNNFNAQGTGTTTRPPYIGKIMITENQPVTPLEFYAWVNEDVSLGSFLVAEDPNGQDRVLAFVENVQAISTFKDPFNEYFSHEMGNPAVIPSTLPTTVRVVKCKVIYSTKPLTPITSRLSIRRPTRTDLVQWISSSIPETRRILGGLTKICNDENSPTCWAPYYYDSEYLLGEQAAHINISGISGVATKTSYAIFLALSALYWGLENGKRIAIVMFNVKGADLLRLYRIPTSWEELENRITSWDPRLAPLNLALWRAIREEGFDFIDLFLNPDNHFRIHIFTYHNDRYGEEIQNEINNLRNNASDQRYREFASQKVRLLWYSFQFKDLGRRTDGNTVTSLDRDEVFSIFERDDLTDVMVDAIDTFIEEHSTNRNLRQQVQTFDQLLECFREIASRNQEQGEVCRSLSNRFENRTVLAILRRLRGFVARARHIIAPSTNSNPIRVSYGQNRDQAITAGINVIQLYNLTDAEKRLVVTHVLNEIKYALETQNRDQRDFDKVLIFVDELNLYAPKEGSPISEFLRDIAARGRFLGLSLMGAEQFASLIDEEVYGNSATKVLGRQSQVEITKEIYRGLGDLRDFAAVLDKGQMIIDNPLLLTPIIVRYPIPMHELPWNTNRNAHT